MHTSIPGLDIVVVFEIMHYHSQLFVLLLELKLLLFLRNPFVRFQYSIMNNAMILINKMCAEPFKGSYVQ